MDALAYRNVSSHVRCFRQPRGWAALLIGLCAFAHMLSGHSAALAQNQQLGSLPPQVKPTDDPPAKIARVLQNRAFRKALRPEVSFFGGSVLNEAYSSTYGTGVRLGFFFNEFLGIDYSYTYFSSGNSADLNALQSLKYYKDDTGKEQVTVSPSTVRLKNNHALLVSYVPIYGKINLMDFEILYSDIYVSAGMGMLETTDTESPRKTPIMLGLGQRFYFGKYYNFRLDGWDHMFVESRRNGDHTSKSTRHAWLVSAGMSVFLWGPGE